MTDADIKDRMTEIFRDVLDNDAITLTEATTAADIEEWDSLAHINLLVTMEKEFKVKFVLAEIKPLRNVGDMIRLVKEKLPA